MSVTFYDLKKLRLMTHALELFNSVNDALSDETKRIINTKIDAETIDKIRNTAYEMYNNRNFEIVGYCKDCVDEDGYPTEIHIEDWKQFYFICPECFVRHSEEQLLSDWEADHKADEIYQEEKLENEGGYDPCY